MEGVCFSKADILFVLRPKKLTHKRLLFVMLCHAKFCANDGVAVFDMPYSVMSAMGVSKNRVRLLKVVKELEKDGYIEVVNNSLEAVAAKRIKQYKLLKHSSDKTVEWVNAKTDVSDFERVVTALVPQKELKRLVGRAQYYETFYSFYEIQVKQEA